MQTGSDRSRSRKALIAVPVDNIAEASMNWRVSLAAVGLVLICATHGIAADPVACGERVTLHSKILGEDRTVFISVPVSYARGTQRYPVFYLTDAQWHFDQSRTSA